VGILKKVLTHKLMEKNEERLKKDRK